jgi:hypothetical protein
MTFLLFFAVIVAKQLATPELVNGSRWLQVKHKQALFQPDQGK